MVNSDAFFGDVVEQYARHINPYLGKLMSFAGFGVEMRAEGCYIYDHEGRVFLDFLGGYGVFSLGHRHPKIIEAVKKQLDTQPMSGKAFFNPVMAELATKLARVSPEGLEYTFFSNSGAEAVECALKLAKAYTGRSKIFSTNGSYHGKTIGALSTTGRDKYRAPFEPLMPGVVFADYNDLDAAKAIIDTETACVLIETIQGEGGIHVASDSYLRGLRELCDKTGALLIVDEVQTGLGRTGKTFGCEHSGIRPDIMTLAKCLSGGVVPIGATMATTAIFEKVFAKNPLAHTSTFGGNPLACAAGLAALQVLEDEGLVRRSQFMGERLMAGLREVQQQHSDFILEVRGKGLMVGVEFRMDEVGELVIGQMLKRGMCAAYTLNNPRVIRFEPPLTIDEKQIDQGVEWFGEAVTETAELLAMLA